jgi:large-conductance mechanosensitive channel
MTMRTARGYAAVGAVTLVGQGWRVNAMLGYVLETLTGIGLAGSAGLNAYIPLLMLGLLGRFTDLVSLPNGWSWLENPAVLGILAVLLAIEVVADKIPLVDHLNDMVQTVVRPTAGGLAFGAASSSQTVTVSDPAHFFSSNQWVPIAAGMGISFVVHAIKAMARPIINASTVGLGAPVASSVEDVISVVVSFAAILFPFLIVLFVIFMIWMFIILRRRRQRRRAEKLAKAEEERIAREIARDGHTLDLWRRQ